MVVGLGYRYASTAVIGGQPPPSLEDVERDLDGTPGSRLPHAWLEREGARLSTLDVAGTAFALLAGPEGRAWCDAATAAAAGLGLDLVAWRVAADGDAADPGGRWCAASGIGPAGALLVRPDRFVAWRATAPAGQRLRAVLSDVLDRAGAPAPAGP
jgi:putative polyketide hydroxylase